MIAGCRRSSAAPTTQVVRDKVMRIYTLMEIARYTSLRVQAAKAAGRGPGPRSPPGSWSPRSSCRQLRDVGLEALGPTAS